jgi:site-specific DNA recombinase
VDRLFAVDATLLDVSLRTLFQSVHRATHCPVQGEDIMLKEIILLKAVLYIRMSTLDQEDSPEQQRKELLARFGTNYEIVGEYLDEGKSGSKDVEKRTDFTRLLADSAKGGFQVILCYDLSRFSRLDTIEAAFAKKTLRDNGIRLVTVLEGEIDWNTSTGRIVDSVMSEAQHEYSVKLARNTLRGKLDRAKKGQPYGQLTPYGLSRLITEPQGTTRIIHRTERFRKPEDWKQHFVAGDDKEVAVVEGLFKDFNRSDVSYHELARKLNNQGVPSPSGKKWGYQTIIQILTNARYVGDLTIGKDGAGKFFRLDGDKIVVNTEKKMRTNKPDPLKIEGTHKGIIDRTLFDDVQKKVKRRWKSGKHACREEAFALGGVLYCGGCGKPLYGNDGTKRSKSRDGVKYSCKGEHRTPDCECGQWGIHEDEVLPFLLLVLLEQIDKRIVQQADAPVPQIPIRDTTRLEKRLEKLKSEYKVGLQRFLRLPEAMKEFGGDLDDELKQWKAEIDQIEQEIDVILNSEDSWGEVLRKRRAWWASMRDKLTFVATSTVRSQGRSYSAGVNLTDSAIRELFHRIDCRLTLWFERASAKRYRIVRGRLTAGTRHEEFDVPDFDKDGLPNLSKRAGERNGSDPARFDNPASDTV